MSIRCTDLPGLVPTGTNFPSPFLRHFSGSSGDTILPSASSRLPSRSRLNTPRKFQPRSEEHTSELQSLMRISYAVFCLKKKTIQHKQSNTVIEHDLNRLTKTEIGYTRHT